MKFAIFLLCFAAFAPALAAQAAPQSNNELRGMVSNATSGEGVPYASVELRAANGRLVTGVLTAADGKFQMVSVPPGHYSLRVASIGFATLQRSVDVVKDQPVIAIGKIAITPVAIGIDSLTITAQRREVHLAPERNTFVVKDMPATVGGTAIDVLRNVPSVEIDADNNVSLRGNQNVVVQLNGRAVPMTGLELGNFLAQIPAHLLDRIEVVPNPSAKYDPEGMAGIVNIVLKQNVELGWSGSLSLTAGTTGQINPSAMLGVQHGKLSLLNNYAFLRDPRDMRGFTDLTLPGASASATTYQNQAVSGDRTRSSHTFTSSAEYKLDKLNSLTGNLILSKRGVTNFNDVAITNLDASRQPTALQQQLLNGTSNSHSVDAAFGFRRASKVQFNSFASEVRYFDGKNVDDNIFSTEQLTLAGNPVDASPALFRNTPDTRRRNGTAQADYSHALGKNAKLEAGYKGTLRRLDSNLAVSNFSYPQNRYVVDTNRSSNFTYDERVNALYAVLSTSANHWDLQGGLRFERADTKFTLHNNATTYDNHYNTAYPSALAAYNFDEQHQLKFAYSKRVRRPDADHMNPFTEYEDALDVSTGNPYLKPEYTHSFQVGYQLSGEKTSLQVSPFFRHTVNAERRIRSIDNTGLTTVTFANVASSDSWGTEAIASLRAHDFSGFGAFTAFRQVTDGSNLPTDFSNNAFGWSARFNGTYTINSVTDLQLLYNYRAPMTVEQGRIYGQSQFNIALREKLRGDKLTATLRVNDPLRQNKSGFRSTDPRLLQVTERSTFVRGLFLGVSYNFGKAPRIRDRLTDQPDAGS